MQVSGTNFFTNSVAVVVKEIQLNLVIALQTTIIVSTYALFVFHFYHYSWVIVEIII